MGWTFGSKSGVGKRSEVYCFGIFGRRIQKEKPVVLIGKGVMFDTGGYNLKPINHIETMHQDMADWLQWGFLEFYEN